MANKPDGAGARGAWRAARLALVLGLAGAPAAHAIEWRVEPSVRATATYTDNVRQSASNTQDALILSATPSVMLRSEGSRRLQASLQYGFTGVSRFGGDSSDNLYHMLNALGKAELVRDFLYVDGAAHISQELISILGSPADATTNNSNRTTVGTYSISPYVQHRLGTFAIAQARYTASGAMFQNNVAANSSINAFTASLLSGTRFNDLSWGLNYSLRKAQNRNAADTTLESANVTAGYALSSHFRVFGMVGQDWNDYLSTTGTSGSFYSAGVGWSPTRRTSIEASAGERYFGRTFSLAATHRTRMSRWNASYSENVSDITQQFLAQSSRIFWLCGANLNLVETADLTNPAPGSCIGPISAGQLATAYSSLGVSTSDLIAAGLLNIATTSGIYVIKNARAGVSWDVGRLSYGLVLTDTRRLYQALAGAEDRVQAVIGSVSYRLSAQTTATGGLSLTRNTADALVTGGAPRQDDILSVSLGLNRRFDDKLDGALIFRHTHRDSNLASATYDENALTALVNMRF